MLDIEDLRVGYQHFFRITQSENFNYSFLFTGRSSKIATKAIQLFDKKYSLHSLGHRWLFKYLFFQFEYWSVCDIKQFNGKVDFSFIFGEKAVKRFFDRGQEWDYQLEEKKEFKGVTERNFLSLFNSLLEKESHVDDLNKSMFLNTTKGLQHCLTTTSLYNHLDSSCISCKFKTDCKKLLMINYPIIYKNRKYK